MSPAGLGEHGRVRLVMLDGAVLDDGALRAEPAPAPAGSSREAILDAAEELMAQRGYAAASISAICRASGLPVGSVYHHFGNKAGILAAVMERAGARFLAAVAELDEPAASPEQRLRTLYDNAAELLLCNVRYLRIWNNSLVGADRGPADRIAVGEVTADTIARAIRPVAAAAGVADPDALAASLARLSNTYARGALLEAEYDPGRLREEMAPLHDVVLAAITARAAQDPAAPAGRRPARTSR